MYPSGSLYSLTSMTALLVWMNPCTVLGNTLLRNKHFLEIAVKTWLLFCRHSLGDFRISKDQCMSCKAKEESTISQADQINNIRLLDKHIKNLGKRRKRNVGDGHCILYSFLDGLAETGYNQYRKVSELFPLIENEILTNLNFYGPFVGEVDLVKELGEYFHSRHFDAGVVDLMLHVLTNITQTSVVVYYVHNAKLCTYNIPPSKAASQRTIYLAKNGQHYEAVLGSSTSIMLDKGKGMLSYYNTCVCLCVCLPVCPLACSSVFLTPSSFLQMFPFFQCAVSISNDISTFR